jgi:two-component system phosphate regulon sensor histidine kinase PhoR
MGCPFHGEQTSEIVGVDRPVELIRKNGEVAQVILGVDYLGEWEEYYRYSAAITDVTEIVQARDLEKQARERFEQLQRAWRHDLLSSVKGTWDMFDQLAVLDAKFSNPIQQEAFEIAGRKAKLAYELVRDTRNIGDSIEKITMVIIPVSEIFDRLKTMYSSYNITYFDAESPERIKVDVNQFVGRGLANIVNNAIKYSGGLNEVIEIGFKVKGAHGIFYVKDQGIGMDAEGQAKILSGSYGVAVRLNQEFEGTGLGLYSAQQIFKAHNASISVKSQLGQGSIFFVKIPLHRHENESLVNDS